ncbi:MAG: hypothetical protein ABJE47_23675 [bacterium]
MQSPELFLPGESLVQATVDARALRYLPSVALVARTLSGSRKGRQRFRLPASLARPTAYANVRLTRARAASLALAALGLSPAALAAATFVQLLLVVGMVQLMVPSARAIRDAFAARPRAAVRSEQVTYCAVLAGTPASAAAARKPSHANDSSVESVLDEFARSLDGEITVDGARAQLSAAGRVKLDRVAAILRRFPVLRVTMEADTVPVAIERGATPLGARDAEFVYGELLRRGVPRNRMAIGLMAGKPIECGEGDLKCPFGPRLVHIRLANRP